MGGKTEVLWRQGERYTQGRPRGSGRGLALEEPRAVTQAAGQMQSSGRALIAEGLCPASEALISVFI